MVKSCCVKNCLTSKKKSLQKVSLHLFPLNNAELLKKWVDFMGYDTDWQPRKYSAICSRHFSPKDYRLNTNLSLLKPNTVPTIKNENESKDENSTANTIEIPNESTVCNETTNIQYNTMCRLCGVEYKANETNLKHIFENKEYAIKIHKYLHLTILPDDLLPLFLCISCEKNINQFEKFINQVNDTQKKLFQIFSVKHIDNIKSTNEEIINSTNEEIPKIDNIKSSELNQSQIFNSEYISNTENITSYTNNYVQNFFITNVNMKSEAINKYVCDTVKPVDNSIKFQVMNNDFGTFNNNISSIKLSDNLPPCNSILSNINVKCSQIDESILKIPIKLETMTPSLDFQQPVNITKSSGNLNKKIEILQDIKIDPNQIDFKSFKSIYDESLSHVNKNILQKSIQDTVKGTNNLKNNKKTFSKTLLTNSTAKCEYCSDKFISKYALNHHKKYICKLAISKNEKNIKNQLESMSVKDNIEITRKTMTLTNLN